MPAFNFITSEGHCALSSGQTVFIQDVKNPYLSWTALKGLVPGSTIGLSEVPNQIINHSSDSAPTQIFIKLQVEENKSIFSVKTSASDCLCIEAVSSGLELMPCKEGNPHQIFNTGGNASPITVGPSNVCVSGGSKDRPLVYSHNCADADAEHVLFTEVQ
jgi:hypothetical protein